MVRRRHVDTSYQNNVSGWALSCDWSSCDYFHLSWNMSDWHLIWWFLDLDILITNKFTRFNLQNQLSFNLILNALLTWAFNQRCELLLLNNLVHFKSTCITSIHCNLNARFNIRASSNNTFDNNKGAYTIGFDLSHIYRIFLWILARSNTEMISSLKFWRNTKLLWFTMLSLFWKSLRNHSLICIYRIKSPLRHNNIIWWLHSICMKVLTWLWKFLIDDSGKQTDISWCVHFDSSYKPMISSWIKEFFDIT